ncbi:MAG: hypothetical protein R3C55_09935 [Parvularculaceae bacterium]
MAMIAASLVKLFKNSKNALRPVLCFAFEMIERRLNFGMSFDGAKVTARCAIREYRRQRQRCEDRRDSDDDLDCNAFCKPVGFGANKASPTSCGRLRK